MCYRILIWKLNIKKLMSTDITYLFTIHIISLFILSLISNKSNNHNILIIHWKQLIQIWDVFQRCKKNTILITSLKRIYYKILLFVMVWHFTSKCKEHRFLIFCLITSKQKKNWTAEQVIMHTKRLPGVFFHLLQTDAVHDLWAPGRTTRLPGLLLHPRTQHPTNVLL